MEYFRKIWDILVYYALEQNAYRNKTTASNFETAVDIAIRLGIDVRYNVSLNGRIKGLVAGIEDIRWHKTFM